MVKYSRNFLGQSNVELKIFKFQIYSLIIENLFAVLGQIQCAVYSHRLEHPIKILKLIQFYIESDFESGHLDFYFDFLATFYRAFEQNSQHVADLITSSFTVVGSSKHIFDFLGQILKLLKKCHLESYIDSEDTVIKSLRRRIAPDLLSNSVRTVFNEQFFNCLIGTLNTQSDRGLHGWVNTYFGNKESAGEAHCSVFAVQKDDLGFLLDCLGFLSFFRQNEVGSKRAYTTLLTFKIDAFNNHLHKHDLAQLTLEFSKDICILQDLATKFDFSGCVRTLMGTLNQKILQNQVEPYLTVYLLNLVIHSCDRIHLDLLPELFLLIKSDPHLFFKMYPFILEQSIRLPLFQKNRIFYEVIDRFKQSDSVPTKFVNFFVDFFEQNEDQLKKYIFEILFLFKKNFIVQYPHTLSLLQILLRYPRTR